MKTGRSLERIGASAKARRGAAVRWVAAVGLVAALGACGGSAGDPASAIAQSSTSSLPAMTDPGTSTTTPGAADTTSTTSFLDWVFSLETIPGITGYGDFSQVDLLDVDHYLVNELIYRCARDHGVPVTIAPEGDGIFFDDVPEAQSRQASEIVAACTNGLNLPQGTGEYGGLTFEQAERMFAHLLWVRDCLDAAGYPQADPPSFDVWLENQYWHPYRAIPSLNAGNDPALARRCPQWPGALLVDP
jgi:hypothetical protein